MIVVSDTTPLNYLVLIGAVDVLPKLFKEAYAPPEVIRELNDADAPNVVRNWALHPPDWLKIRAASARLPSTSSLDAAEADAISLAKEIGAPAILLDEKKGRKIAIGEGLVVVRTLALLELAAEKQLIELRPALDKLRTTTFRIEKELLDEALFRDAARQAARNAK